MRDWFVISVISNRWHIAVIVLLACIAGQKYARQALQPNNEISIWFSEHDSSLNAYNDFQMEFGNDRVIVLAFMDDDILSQRSLTRTAELTSALSEISGIHDVRSIINARDFRRLKTGSVTKVKFSTWFDDESVLSISGENKKLMLASPLLVGRFINREATVSMLVICLEPINRTDARRDVILKDIAAVSSSILEAGAFHLGGLDVITNGLNELSSEDFPLFTGVGFLMMFMVILVLYRSVSCFATALLTTACSVWLTLSVCGIAGLTLNIFTVMVPPIVITVSVIGVMHLINEFENAAHDNESNQERSRRALSSIFYPSLFATLTTIVGFSSLATSDTAVLKQFGWLTSVGVGFSFLLSFVFGAIFLPIHRRRRQKPLYNFDMNLELLPEHLARNRKLYWVAFGLIIAVACFGMSRIKVDMYPMGYFPTDHKVVRDQEFMVKQWGEFMPVDMVLQMADSFDLGSPAVIQAMLRFDDSLIVIPAVRQRYSLLTALDRFSMVAYGKGLKEMIRDPLALARFIRQFNKLTADESPTFVSKNKKKARITLIGPSLSVRDLEKNIDEIEAMSRRQFGALATLQVAGYPALYVKVMNYAFSSMFSSLLFAFLLIFVALLLMLKNWRLALIALAPNIFPLIVLLGALGFLDINLDLATCSVSAIVLGIAIDDTIYFMHHFQNVKSAGLTTIQSLQQTQRHVSRVIVLTSIVLCAGFSILLLASLKTVFYFGLLAGLSSVAALVGDVVMLPLILMSGSNKR